MKLSLVVALFFAVFAPPSQAIANPWLLLDAKSGKLIAQNQATHLWHPASITKLMTAYVVFREILIGRIDLSSPVRISKLALSMPSSKMGLPVGTIMNVDNALKMIMVKSANDVAVALAEATSGSLDEFVKSMNSHAARLGMAQSNFTNPHGLHSIDQVTTAKDMALLTLAIQNEFPQYSSYFNISAIRFGKVRMKNHNKLIFNYPGTNGMKTGYTCPSGLNVIARARRGDRELIAIVLGGYSALQRNVLAAKLLSYGFSSRTNITERILVRDLKPQLKLYAIPGNLKPIICKPSWSERQMSKKQRRNNRKLHQARMKKLQKKYFNQKVETGPTQRVVLGLATGLNPFDIKLANGSTPKPIIGLPVWRPDRTLPPYE